MDNQKAEEPAPLCKYCKETLNPAAVVCPQCGRDQHAPLGWFQPEKIGLVISIVMMLAALVQLNMASNERSTATDALNKANSAIAEIQTIQEATASLERKAKLDVIRSKIESRQLLLNSALLSREIEERTQRMSLLSGTARERDPVIELSLARNTKKLRAEIDSLENELSRLEKVD
jgi:hypothetical protein